MGRDSRTSSGNRRSVTRAVSGEAAVHVGLLRADDQDRSAEMKDTGCDTMLLVPPQECSQRRREYFARANRILGTYSVVSAYSHFGQQAVDAAMAKAGRGDDTPIRVDIGGHLWMTRFGAAKRMFAGAGAELANQCFLMTYGNFEAFLTDLIHDALQAQGSGDPVHESIGMMMGCSWEGKLDRIGKKLGFGLGKGIRAEGFAGVEMEIMGRRCDDPAHLLERCADLRHRLVHGSGCIDKALLTRYPSSGRAEGEPIQPRTPLACAGAGSRAVCGAPSGTPDWRRGTGGQDRPAIAVRPARCW
jgi:hypothetical protein